MYAIIKTGGKQYRVQQGDEFKIEKLDAKVGEKVVFDEVVAVGGDKLIVGNPLVSGYVVNAEVLEQGKADKVVIYKYKAKKDYRRKNGHRQPFTLVKITGIGEGKAAKASAEKKSAAAKSDSAEKKPAAKAADKADKKADAPKISASMKKDELLAVAKEMGVKVDSKATKADIIAAIEAK